MKLITKRLILREPTIKDVKNIKENVNNLNVAKWLLVVPYPYSLKDAKDWIKKSKKEKMERPRKNYSLIIELKSEKKVIGCIGLHKVDKYQGKATVGYWLGEKYWRQGYGFEALNEVIKFVFNKLKLRRLEADVFVGNPSSGKLLEKFGFKKEGLKRKASRCKADGKIKAELVYGLLKEEWKK